MTKSIFCNIIFLKLYNIHREGEEPMPKVEVGKNEPLEKALRRFKKKIEREGVLKQLKARKHYEKPSERRRKKGEAQGSGRALLK